MCIVQIELFEDITCEVEIKDFEFLSCFMLSKSSVLMKDGGCIVYIYWTSGGFRYCTGWGIWSDSGLVDFDLLCFTILPSYSSHFCQFPISLSRTRQTEEQPKSKSTQPSYPTRCPSLCWASYVSTRSNLSYPKLAKKCNLCLAYAKFPLDSAPFYLSVGVLDRGDVGVPERAVDESEHEAGLADAAGAEDDDAVVVTLLGHGGGRGGGLFSVGLEAQRT